MSERTTVVFIRHGQTDWNVARRWQGQLDIPLNDTGRGQARAVARRLRHWSLAALYTSDLSRAAGCCCSTTPPTWSRETANASEQWVGGTASKRRPPHVPVYGTGVGVGQGGTEK